MSSTLRADLALPDDWTDLLLDAEDEGAQAHYLGLVRGVLPTAPAGLVSSVVRGLLLWRRRLQEHRVLSCGLVVVPEDGDEPGATWQVLTALVDVPVVAEADLGTVLLRMVETTDDPSVSDAVVHAESFETDLGVGFGLLSLPVLVFAPDALGVSEVPAPRQVGLAVGLTLAPGAGAGLLTVGMALDPAQLTELGALVASITAHSLLVPAGAAEPVVEA